MIFGWTPPEWIYTSNPEWQGGGSTEPLISYPDFGDVLVGVAPIGAITADVVSEGGNLGDPFNLNIDWLPIVIIGALLLFSGGKSYARIR